MNALARQADAVHLARSAAEAERGLLGACMSYPLAPSVVLPIVSEDQFSEAVHVSIWRSMSALVAEGSAVNPVTLGAVLGNDPVSDGVTMRQYLAHLCAESWCPASSVLDVAKQVRDFWAIRQIISRCEQASAFASSPGAQAKELISYLMQELDQTRARMDTRFAGFKAANAVAVEVVESMASHYSGEAKKSAVPTGVADLDYKLCGGMHRGNLIILAGRPGMGKSISAVSLSRQSASHGHAGGIFSLEMTGKQLGSRYLSDMLYDGRPLTSSQILYGNLSEQDAERVADMAHEFGNLPLHIDDTASLSVGEVSARARSLADRFSREGKRLSFIYIDYLKFLRASDRYRGQRHYEVGEISAGLKTLAKDLDIAVVLLAQLNRQVEQREDKRPQLSDLRESGDLEADADAVIFVYREAYYLEQKKPKEEDREAFAEWLSETDKVNNKLEFIIAKQRMGPTGMVEAFCDVGASAIRNLAKVENRGAAL